MHFKYSLLTASLAAALTLSGCGGGEGGDSKKTDSDESVPPITGPVVGGVVITTIDGYLKNALVCSDLNDDGKCQPNEIIRDSNGNVGLTNENGQLDIEVSKVVEDSFNSHPVVVKILEPYTDYRNFDVQPGIYTVDMDQPNQAMGKNVSFRAPAGAKIASPITDLIVVEMNKGNDQAAAEANVQAMLSSLKDPESSAEIDLYADYIETKTDAGADDAEKELATKLHKTAQILTETQHQAADDNIELDTVINDVVDQAVIEVVKMADAGDDNLYNPDYKPVVTVKEDNGEIDVGEVVANYVAVVDDTKYAALVGELEILELNNKDEFDRTISESVEGLFEDRDLGEGSYPPVSPTTASVEYLAEHGISVTLNDSQQLVIRSDKDAEGNSIAEAGEYYIELASEDKDAKGNTVGQVKTLIEFKVDVFQSAPEVNTAQKGLLQEEINGLELQEGRSVDTYIDIEKLFTDKDGDTLSYNFAEGHSGLRYELVNSQIHISGTPNVPGSFALTITARDDDNNQVEVKVTLKIAEKPRNPLSDLIIGLNLYRFEVDWGEIESEQATIKPKCWAARFTDDNKVLRADSADDSCPAEGEIQTEIGSWEIDGNSIKVAFDNDDPLKLILQEDVSGDANLPRVHLNQVYQKAAITQSGAEDYTLESETQTEPVTFFISQQSAEAYWQQSTADVNIKGELISVEVESKSRAAVESDNDILDVDVFLGTSCENLGFVEDSHSSSATPSYTFSENMAYEFFLLSEKFESSAYSLHQQTALNSVAFGADNNTKCAIDFDYPGISSSPADIKAGDPVVVYAYPVGNSASEAFVINSYVDRDGSLKPKASLDINTTGIYIPILEELAIERWYRDAQGAIKAEMVEYAPLTEAWNTLSRNDIEFSEYDVKGNKLVQVWEWDTHSGTTEYDSFTVWTDGEQVISSADAGAEGTNENYPFVTSLQAAKTTLLEAVNSRDQVINSADGAPFAVYNPLTFIVKAHDANSVIGKYDPFSGEVFDATGQLVYRYNQSTKVITNASGKTVGSLNDNGTITIPSDPDGGDGNNGGDGDTAVMTPEQFKSHGDVLEQETITVQSESSQTVVTINSDVTVFGNLTIKDSE